MGITAAKLLVQVNADTKQATTDIEKFEKRLLMTEKAGEALSKIGKAMTVGVTAPLAVAGLASVKFASDLNESMNKVNVVFGEASKSVQDFASSASTSMGMSRQAALEATGTFGNLFTSMGLAIDQSAEMSTGLVQLASDLASFNNIDPTVALEKLRAGLVGEVEPLRTLGVNLSAAATQAKAMEMGLADSTEALTPAMLAQARYALILEQTKNAQGDFARTSGDTANAMRVVKAQVQDLGAAFGQEMLPLVKDLVNQASVLLKGFQALPPETKKLIVEIAGITAVAGPAILVLGKLVGALASLASVSKLAMAGIAAVGGPITLIVAGLASLGAAIGLAIQDWEDYKQATQGTGRTAQETMDSLAKAAGVTSLSTGKIHDQAGAWDRVKASAAEAAQQVSDATQQQAEDIQAAADAYAAFQQAAAETALQAGLSGELSGAVEDYRSQLGELIPQQQALEAEIEKAITLGWLPTSQYVQNLTADLAENKTAQENALTAMREATAQMIYQQAAAGLDAGASLELARSMGMISEADYAVSSSLQALRAQYDANYDGSITAAEGAGQYAGQVDLMQQAVQQLQAANMPVTVENIQKSMEDLSTVDVSMDDLLPDSKAWQTAALNIDTYKINVTTALTELTTTATTETQNTLNALGNANFSGVGTAAGTDIVTGFKTGLTGSEGGGLVGITKTTIETIKKLWKDDTWNGVGKYIVQGIASGVSGNAGLLSDAVRRAVAAALAAAQKASQSHSPSKLFADEVGKPISQGMALGVLQAAPLPVAAMQTVINQMAGTTYNQPITVQANIRNELDYYQLANVIAEMLGNG